MERARGGVIMHTRVIAVFSALVGGGCALAQPDPSGIEFVTIGAAGNAPWAGDGTPGDRAIGRGRVDYEHRIGRFEVTTAQWVEFYNAAFDRPRADWIPHLAPPDAWGAVPTTPNTPGGLRWRVPAGHEMLPTGNISWRMAAIYCNWLHNDKSPARAAFLSGAYDVSTFGYLGQSSIFTDQFTRSPGARYAIPTWDEWLKAVHYDPNKANPDGSVGGWWLHPNMTDIPLTYGPPGLVINGHPTQANGGWDDLTFPGFNPWRVPLGAYPSVMSPWGLLDAAGGATEWTEEVMYVNDVFRAFRLLDGSALDTSDDPRIRDRVSASAGAFPSLSTHELGLRGVELIPTPGGFTTLMLGMAWSTRRRTRHGGRAHESHRNDARVVSGTWGGAR
jgi:formylglycine-generating enzyme required for sulfatase activity